MTTLEHMSSHMCWAELPLLSLSLQYCQYWNVGHIEGGREGGREPSLHWVVTNLSLCIKWKYFWSTVKPLSQTTVTKKLRVLCGFLELRLRQSRLISSSLHLLLRSFLLMDWTGLEWLDWSGLARKVSRPAMASGAVEGSVLFVSQMVMNYQVKKRLNCLNASQGLMISEPVPSLDRSWPPRLGSAPPI